MARSSSPCSSRSCPATLIALLVTLNAGCGRRPLLRRAARTPPACPRRSPSSPGRCPCGPSSRSPPRPPAPAAPSGPKSACASSGSRSRASCFALGFFLLGAGSIGPDARPSLLAGADRLALPAPARPLLRPQAAAPRADPAARSSATCSPPASACSPPTSPAALLIDAPPVVLNLMLPGARGAAAAGLFEIARKLSTVPLDRPPGLPICARAARPRPRPMSTAPRSRRSTISPAASRPPSSCRSSGLLDLRRRRHPQRLPPGGAGGPAAALHPGRRARRSRRSSARPRPSSR